jgi:hypothetical protein
MRLAVIPFLLLPSLALAQQTAPLPPEVEACQQTILKLTGEQLQWQTQTITLQRHVADLNKQLASTEPPKTETPK